ncbi:MAG: CehA/McbA family metallohydrolase [Mycobacteriales bacterium]
MRITATGATTLSTVDAYGTARSSPLLPGLTLVHADLHNHSRLSDGAGDPADAFDSMRRSGLDVGALTDHANLATPIGDLLDGPVASLFGGIDAKAWRRLGELAELANDEGRFVALRGFEWSHPVLGHVSVWGTQRYTHPLKTVRVDMERFYDWLTRDDAGSDGLAGFNHPGGRDAGRFAGFRYHAGLGRRLVSLEMFNKVDEYLFAGTDQGQDSPLTACLAAGWRPALTGVSDEHGDDWGVPEGKGRAGLYVTELTRAGVREALLARRTFASRVKGLRLAATLGGVPMGGTVAHRQGPVTVDVDLDLGPESWGSPLSVQVLVPGSGPPGIASAVDVRVPGPGDPGLRIPVELDAEAHPWAVVRVSDPGQPADFSASGDYVALGRSIAFASPFWLEPAGS